MDGLNIVLFLLFLVGFLVGFFHGLIKELASLAAIILGVVGAQLFAPTFAHLLSDLFDISINTTRPIAYVLLFIGIAMVLLLIARIIEKFFSALALGGINKIVGGVFGVLKMALIVSVFLNVFEVLDNRFSFIKKETKINSSVYTTMIKFGPVLWDEVFVSEKKDTIP